MLCILLLHHLKEPMAVDIQTCAMKTGKPPALQRLLDTNSKWAPVPGNLDCRCGSPIKEWVIKRRCKQVFCSSMDSLEQTRKEGNWCMSSVPTPGFIQTIKPTAISHITDEVMEIKLAIPGPKRQESWCRWHPHSTHPFSLWKRKMDLEKWCQISLIRWWYQIPLLLLG